ncbi:MAG: shikimate kinase [Alphaproteobacteria bacterium]|nr:shikimate kinase [Alphaproteobacteria bacterium]
MTEQEAIAAIAGHLDRPVVLVGMMGAGKTYLGKVLARSLGVEFYDSDSLVEERAGASIADIFAKEGETAFRVLEAGAIASLLSEPPAVISTGGGAVTNPETLTAIKDRAYSIWVEASLPDMLERVSRNKRRPLIRDAADPEAVLSGLLAKRQDLYAQADIHVMNRNDDGNRALDDILTGLAKALKIS